VMVKLPERNNYESKIWFLNQTTATASGDYSGNLLQPALAEANLDAVEGWTHMRWEVMYETEVPITCWRATDDPIWVPGGSAYLRVSASEWPSGMSGIPYLVDLDRVTGDVNGDGAVDVADVNLVINMMLGKAAQVPAADISGDGTVDVSDANIVINIMLGKQ
ncbi:MAG: dockerin type I repeat-containing protein, partial [Muribaculaceae bacterium]|nr:dockerin type I repeat-containing protein [Muribaculaceae bacterium]